MRKACLFYTNKLYEKHLGRPLTPAVCELILQDLTALQNQMKQKESNTVWQVPVGLMFDFEQSQFEVVVSDEENVLYLDFDQP